METKNNRYIAVSYELYTDNSEGIHELVEAAPAEHPFQFISGMGIALESFEEKMLALAEGEDFDFTLTKDQAYGDYMDEHVLSLDKKMFEVDGHFDNENIVPGHVIDLMNEDGNRFPGLVLEIKADKVVVDLNPPLAGKSLHFKGKVTTSRPATDEEIQGVISRMSGEGCSCGSCGDGGCGEGGCNCGHDHEHEGEGCGCGHCH